MTNFFGSVMETIHTDSAYKALSRKSSAGVEIKIPSDQSAHNNERKTLTDSNIANQSSGFKTEVTSIFPFLWFFLYLGFSATLLLMEGTHVVGSEGCSYTFMGYFQ